VPFLGFTQLDYGNLAATHVAPIGSPIYQKQLNAFAPRLGIAYRLLQSAEWGQVLRAGWGMFYDTTGDYANINTVNGPNASQSKVTFPATATQQDPRNINPNPNTAPWGNVISVDPNLRLPRVY